MIATLPASKPSRCSLRHVWLGWCDWRAERQRAAQNTHARRRQGFRLARRCAGALALLLVFAALVSQMAPPVARAAAQSDTSALPALAAGALIAATLGVFFTSCWRAVRFVRHLCKRGQAIEARLQAR